jgi:D-arabinose 1-dehydrogenase-like Zn-dependent alcohol dehydrogenase
MCAIPVWLSGLSLNFCSSEYLQIKASVFFTVVRSLKIVGSYVGNRMDAIEAVDFAARGKVITTVDKVLPLEALPQVYKDMTAQKVVGRIVLNLYVYLLSYRYLGRC